jgi:glutamyl-tRNA synthetase
VGGLIGFLFVKDLEPDPALMIPKRWDAAKAATALVAARHTIAEVGRVSWEADEIEPPLRRLVEEGGWKVGDLFMTIRVAITGRTVSPPLFDTMVALGYERTLARIDRAIERLEAQPAVTP